MVTMTTAAPPATRAGTADMIVLGSLPILPGEDRTEHERWRAAVIGELKPADLMEKIWTNDIIYLEWEIIRFRRAKANYIRKLRADYLSLPRFTLEEISSEPDPHTEVASVIASNIGTLEPPSSIAPISKIACAGRLPKWTTLNSVSLTTSRQNRSVRHDHVAPADRQSQERAFQHRPEDRSGQSTGQIECPTSRFGSTQRVGWRAWERGAGAGAPDRGHQS
jgi:hypothetical protein